MRGQQMRFGSGYTGTGRSMCKTADIEVCCLADAVVADKAAKCAIIVGYNSVLCLEHGRAFTGVFSD